MLQFLGTDQTRLWFLHVSDALAVVIEVANHANDTMKQGVSIWISGADALPNLGAQASYALHSFSVGQLSETYANSIQLKWTP